MVYRILLINIGMGFILNVVVYDLGYIIMMDLIDKIEFILNSMKEL